MILRDYKITQDQATTMMRPMQLDLMAYFKAVRDNVMSAIDKNMEPEDLIDKIDELLDGENTRIAKSVRKSDKPVNFIQFAGFNIGIESPKGSIRRGKDWEQEMYFDYGFFPDIKAVDGDSLDVYIGPDERAEKVYIIRQIKWNGDFDEYKIMLGFTTRKQALAAYFMQYDSPRYFGGISEEFTEDFRRRIGNAYAQIR